jgi:perosamine synthetase
VIVPAYTFPATANVVELCGARTVFADVDPTTFLVDIDAAAAAVTERTKAVMVVHLFGRPVDWDRLRAAIPERIHLVEDAAGALGAEYRGRKCGSIGIAGCLSFHPRKIVTTGEGGAVTTDDPALAKAVREGRYFGMVMGDHVDLRTPGTNYKLADVLCALGIPQLARLEELLAARERVAGWYGERLPEVVDIPTAMDGDRHGLQAYVIGIDDRDEVRAALARDGIESQIGTYAVHRLSAYAGRGSFPGADRAYERALALPFATTTTEDEVERVCAAVRASVETLTR